jgi:hypothetical protein
MPPHLALCDFYVPHLLAPAHCTTHESIVLVSLLAQILALLQHTGPQEEASDVMQPVLHNFVSLGTEDLL